MTTYRRLTIDDIARMAGVSRTTASMVLGDLGAIVVPVGRTSEVNYGNIAQQSDAALLVNCTPAGMFPHCPDAPCTLEGLDALEGVIDIVYNPARTGLMLEEVAKAENIKVEAADLDKEVEVMAAAYGATPKQVKKIIAEQGRLNDLAATVLRNKTMQFIFDNLAE